MKAAREKWLSIYKETPIRFTADFSSETMKVGKQWDNIVYAFSKSSVQRKKTCQPRLLYLANLSFRNKGKIKTSPDRQKLRVFSRTDL